MKEAGREARLFAALCTFATLLLALCSLKCSYTLFLPKNFNFLERKWILELFLVFPDVQNGNFFRVSFEFFARFVRNDRLTFDNDSFAFSRPLWRRARFIRLTQAQRLCRRSFFCREGESSDRACAAFNLKI